MSSRIWWVGAAVGAALLAGPALAQSEAPLSEGGALLLEECRAAYNPGTSNRTASDHNRFCDCFTREADNSLSAVLVEMVRAAVRADEPAYNALNAEISASERQQLSDFVQSAASRCA